VAAKGAALEGRSRRAVVRVRAARAACGDRQRITPGKLLIRQHRFVMGKGLGSATSAGASTTPRISIAPTHDKHMGSLDVASAHLASNRRRIYGASCSSSTPVWLVFEPGRKTESPKLTSWRRTARPSPHQSASSPTWRAVVFPVCRRFWQPRGTNPERCAPRLLPRSHCWAFRSRSSCLQGAHRPRSGWLGNFDLPEARG